MTAAGSFLAGIVETGFEAIQDDREAVAAAAAVVGVMLKGVPPELRRAAGHRLVDQAVAGLERAGR